MNYIEYINFPSIPNELLDPVETIINSTRTNSIVKQDFFQGRPINNKLQVCLSIFFSRLRLLELTSS
jgi:hypothetical protein